MLTAFQTLMGTGYIKVGYTEADHKWDLHISGEMVVFVVLTAIFLFATLGAWAVFERKYRGVSISKISKT